MTDDGRLRLHILAALVAYDAPASAIADFWTHADGTPYSDDEASLISAATMDDWHLAEALRGGPDQVSDPDATAIAALLRLAAVPGLDALLGLGLREAFLPGGSAPAMARDERTAAFADLYRRLALPGRPDDIREQATVLLGSITHRERT